MDYDVIIIGAGVAYFYQLHVCANRIGIKSKIMKLEVAIGGTWFSITTAIPAQGLD